MMALAKRVFLFLIVNFLVVLAISFFLYIFNVQPFLTKNGLDIRSLAIFCLIWGMGGALISLALSKVTAKWLMNVKIIDPKTPDPQLREVLQVIYDLSRKAGLPKLPEVGIYYSPEVNAFATGPSKSNSLVAVSSGLLQRMRTNEINGVLGHEITHIANGDMVTMTLLQGVINAFVMFFARILAFVVSRALSKDKESESSYGISYLLVFVFEIIFMLLGSIVIATFSRFREFRADAGGARLAGKENMISALHRLKQVIEIKDPNAEKPAVQVFKISNQGGLMRIFASHPPLDERIARLERLSLR
jgi:heat shock protein HtpX